MYKHTRKYLLVILLLLLIIPAQAQKRGYSPGYIIDNNGEIIEGKVKDRSNGVFIDLYTKIRFKPGKALFMRFYSPNDILGYGYNEQHYESLPLAEESKLINPRYVLDEGQQRIFLKIIAGTESLSYYHWEYVDGDSNYLEHIPLFHRAGSNEMVRVSQGMLGLKKKKLKDYFWDCPSLGYAIDNKTLKEPYEVFNFYIEHCGEDPLNGGDGSQ